MQVTTGKRRNPQSVGYNNLIALKFPTIAVAATQLAATVQSRLPLGLNVKIMSVSYVFSGSPAGTVGMNISAGSGTYEGVGSAAYGVITLGGTFAIGDTISIVVGGITSKSTISSRNAGNLQLTAEGIASGINRTAPFGAGFIASSSGPNLYIISTSYGTAANATTLTTSVVSAAGTSTASGATFANGSGTGAVPTMPALDNSNFQTTGPVNTAAPGTALFPVDIPLNVTADVPSIVYPAMPRNFDAIWPSAQELTLRLVTSGSAAGNLDVILWCVPYDVNVMNPEQRALPFLPNQTNL